MTHTFTLFLNMAANEFNALLISRYHSSYFRVEESSASIMNHLLPHVAVYHQFEAVAMRGISLGAWTGGYHLASGPGCRPVVTLRFLDEFSICIAFYLLDSPSSFQSSSFSLAIDCRLMFAWKRLSRKIVFLLYLFLLKVQ